MKRMTYIYITVIRDLRINIVIVLGPKTKIIDGLKMKIIEAGLRTVSGPRQSKLSQV